MTVGVGLNSYWGCAEETTWGTSVTPDRFYEITEEGMDRNNNVITSKGIRAGGRHMPRGSRRALASRDGAGSAKFEVATTQFGRLFKHILGGTPTITQQSSTIAYQHVYSLGSLAGLGLTVQKVIRDSAGTVLSPLTFTGTKVTTAEFANSVNKMLELSLDLDAKDVLTSVGAATLSYPTSPKLFTFAQGSLKFNGSVIANVLDWSCKIDNKLKTDRYYIGQGGTKAEQADADFPVVDGKLTAEFLDQASIYDLFAADTAVAFDVLYEGATIASTFKETFKLTIPEIHLTGDTPKIKGPEIVELDVGFEGAYAGSGADVSITYVTTDMAA